MRWTLVAIAQALSLVAVGAGVGAYTVADWPTLCGFTVGELQTVQKNNTETVRSLGHVAALLYDNSDLLMRYSHWTVGHTEVVPLCPECFNSDISQESDEFIAEINRSPDGVTSDDLVKDSEEIYRAVGATKMAIFRQRSPLVRTLERLRDSRPTTVVTRDE